MKGAVGNKDLPQDTQRQKSSYQGQVKIMFAAAHSELHRSFIFRFLSKPRERKEKYFISLVISFIAIFRK